MKALREDTAQLALWARNPETVDEATRRVVAPAIRVVCLQSGSNGNCTYVETPDVRLLVDAGISAVQVERRLRALGKDARELDAVVLTHEHADHARNVGVYHRKLGLSVFATQACISAAMSSLDLGRIDTVTTFRPGASIRFGGTRLRAVPTPHDAAEGVAFVVTAAGKRVGILTDLGHVFDDLRSVVGSLDGVVIESNYDPEMLSRGPYPAYLKRRIRGPRGHLSNDEAAELLSTCASKRLQWACLAHLSEQNNTPELALAAFRRAVGRRFPLRLASRHGASDEMSV